MRRHHASMHRYATALDPRNADDAVQQACLDGLRGAGSFAGSASVRTWLLTLTRHATFRARRLRSGEPRVHAPLETLGAAAGWGADPETCVARRLDATLLRRALSTLPSEAQEVLILRDLEDLTGSQVASLLALTPAAMKSRLHRARLELAVAVRKEFGHGP